MTRVQNVAVEFLRRGPPHNQLLSKATEYTALCGNLAPHSVQLPFDHFEHETRLARLAYRHAVPGTDPRSWSRDEEARRSELIETGRLMGDLLAAIPGLGEGLARVPAAGADLAHLRLVVTPHELSMLPFECADAIHGQGLKLLLQPELPICLTREVRGAVPDPSRWPHEPRILFAWAGPGGEVPFKAHLLALRQALDIWIEPKRTVAEGGGKRGDDARAADTAERVARSLTVLPFATLDDILEHCSRQRYTHVHILAHGATRDVSDKRKANGLALHRLGRPAEADFVTGDRLANALRFRREDGGLPMMVTIAACGSGANETVVLPGGSIAHTLHVAGVPIVVASQFPLSFRGSVVMTAELYRRTLGGDDVRDAICQTRRRLFSIFDEYHDWASMVVYAALPDDYDQQLEQLQQRVRQQRIDHLLDQADGEIRQLLFVRTVKDEARWDELLGQLDAQSDPKGFGPSVTDWDLGLCASTQKRKAQLLWARVGKKRSPDPHYQQMIAALREAKDLYERAMRSNIASFWTSTQYLSLSKVLAGVDALDQPHDQDEWTAAKVAATYATQSDDGDTVAYGHAALAELHLLQGDASAMRDHVREMVRLMQPGEFPLYSTRRQFRRYHDWWSRLDTDSPSLRELGQLAAEVTDLLDSRAPDG